MTRWLMINKRVLTATWLCALLLLQTQHGDTAPTHHLAVSVEGNTPTLIVTSAEIGITPKIMHATRAPIPLHAEIEAGMTTAGVPTTRSLEMQNAVKGRMQKAKGKSHKSVYGKKWHYAAKEREKSKEKVALTSIPTVVAIKPTTVHPVTRKADIASTNAVSSIQNIESTTKITIKVEDLQANTDVARTSANETGAESNASSSNVVADAIIKPKQFDVKPAEHENGSTPDAGVSATIGSLPHSTEVPTKATRNTNTEPPPPTAAFTSSAVAEVGVATEHNGDTPSPLPRRLNGFGTEQTTAAGSTTRRTILVEKVTATPAFIELHDTTAATATKGTSTVSTTAAANASATAATKVPISATAANVPLIAIQIETLPKAITVTTMSPATAVTTTAVNIETVTNTLIGNGNGRSFSIPSRHEAIKASEAATTTTEFPITKRVDVVTQSGLAVSTSSSIVSPAIFSDVIEKSSTSIGDKLVSSAHPPTEGGSDRVDKQTATEVDSRTPPSRTEMDHKKTTLILTTKTALSETPSAITITTATTTTNHSTPTTQTKQTTTPSVNPDNGIIFIDDVSDNHEDWRKDDAETTPVAEEAEMLHDEAIIGRPGDVRDASAHGDTDVAGGEGGTGTEGVIKLIDLEKHDLKSISKAKQFRSNNKDDTSGEDDGHDGVKKTKKKQLTAKHYLPIAGVSLSAETHFEDLVFGPRNETSTDRAHRTSLPKVIHETHSTARMSQGDILSKTLLQGEKSTQIIGLEGAKLDREPSHSLHYQQIQKLTTSSPPLKPVHNGYLGPILMEKKRFTVFHDPKKLHQHHETSIETQLREGSLVEILAPTSLLEQVTTQPPGRQLLTDTVSMSTTTPAAPLASPFAFIYPINEQSAPMLSTTVFQVPESMSSTTRLPMSTKHLHTNDSRPEQGRLRQQIQQQREFLSTPKFENSERTESKISDIQVEVYDSTVDSIVASTNFKDSEGFYALPLEADADAPAGTTRPPMQPQERFTQYVVDRADYATQESSATPQLNIAAGKPEPAAIEIHINVSEGIGNESEDLEFSYRQPEYAGGNSRSNSMDELMAKTAKAISMRPITTSANARQNESSTHGNVDRGDEILVVEIIDTGDNITEGSLSAENINPIFTFRSDAESDIELKDIKYLPPDVKVKPPQMSDELFLADLKKENGLPKPPLPPPPPPRKPSIDRDSDTIFYISNTEVKVGESLPTANTNYEQQQQQQQQLRKTRLENQFFPANYLASTHPNSAPPQLRYEEDIILSPVRNTADSLKIFRSQGDGAPPLDVTYVGESVMEVEQSSGAGAGVSTTIATAALPAGAVSPSQMPDVIIQPAILPEMSIGVPVIGELPPQIELKEIDFMPDEANQQHSGMYENNMLEDNGNANGNGNGKSNSNGIAIVNSNDVDKLAESSVQYGGDLIDESAGGGGFDGVEGSYPFGNPTVMANNNKAAHHEAEYAHFTVNHGVNNLRKDELSVDVAAAGSGEVPAGQANLENGGELKELLARNGNETFPLSMLANGSYAGLASATERMSNATAYSVMEEERNELELLLKNHYTLVVGAFIVLLPVVLTAALTCTMWLVYLKYFGSASTRNANQTNGNVANGKNGGENGSTEDESTIDPSISVRPKQPLPSSGGNLSNGNCIKTKPNLETHSSVDDTNVTKPSSCPAAAQNHMDNGISVDDGKAGGVMLLPDNVGAAAAPTSISIPMSSFQKPIDNNKLTTTQANIFANNSVQENFTRPNGSVTKMTLKNNHLIVETEERHDISRVARETKMHYNNSEKDGVFVVEVARGVDSKSIPNSPTGEEPRPIYQTPPAAAAAATLRTEDEKVLRNHEEIQIHQPPPETIIQPTNCFEEMPERSLHQIIELEEPTVSPHSFRDDSAKKESSNLVRNSNTGLSQSDLSSTSSTDSNKRYSYGNQELYTIEPASYVSGSPSTILPLVRPSAPNETEDDDRRSENGHSIEHSPAAAQGNGGTAVGKDGSVCNEELSNDVKTNEQVITENNVNEVKSSEAELSLANIEETDIVPVNETVSPVEGISVVGKIKEDGKDRLDSDDVRGKEKEEETTEINEALNEVAENEDEKIGSVKCINNNNKALENANEAPGYEDAECNQMSETLGNFKDEINSENAQNIDQEVAMNTPAAAPLSFAQPILCNYGYDSIISLPDPPSTEEIKELGEFVGIENNQLDSLPPPSPPPPIAADMNDNTTTENTITTTTTITVTDTDTAATNTFKTTTNSSATEGAATATQLKLKELLQNNLTDSTPTKYCPSFVTNGNCHGDSTNGNLIENGHSSVAADGTNENGHESTNGHEVHLDLSPNTGGDNSTGTGKVPETQLTPPESPPLSSPIHYDNSVIVSTINGMNGVNRGICGEPLPIAVDVNGS